MSVGTTWTGNASLTEITCGECGGMYAIAERYRAQKADKGGYWNCPYCKVSWGYGESEVDRLKKRIAQETHRAEQAQAYAKDMRRQRDHTEKRRAAMKGQVTRIKNRVGKGVCPCCNRTFQNLQRHMNGQHPEWAPEKEVPNE